MDVLDISEEVEVRTTRLKKRKAAQANAKACANTTEKRRATARKGSPKPRRTQAPRKSNKKAKSLILNPQQLGQVKEIDKVTLMNAVISRTERELLGDLFPERLRLWEQLKSTNKVQSLVNFSTDKYLKLYDTCSAVCDKDAELFLRWLDVVRSFTCKQSQTEATAVLLSQLFDGCAASDSSQQTLLAIILNAVYLGLSQQMAKTVEEISLATHESETTESGVSSSSKPSDDVALHRICGWALKSASDHLYTQLSTCTTQANSSKLSREYELICSLKLLGSNKCLLPKPVQYLDRGGLTFFKPSFWSWMTAIEVNIAQQLSQRCYRIHGDKLFHITHATISANQDLLDIFLAGIAESCIQATIDTVETVHKILVDKICNARCNEFLRSIGKLACIEKNKSLQARRQDL